jgi:hypothetical protein
MAVQLDFRPAPDTAAPTVPAHGSNLVNGAPGNRNPVCCPRSEQRRKRIAGIAKKAVAAGGMALAIGSSGLVAGGTAAADGLNATPMPPAVIDYDGTHNYDTSSYPADPTWPSPPSWATYPGDSSHPCCSR